MSPHRAMVYRSWSCPDSRSCAGRPGSPARASGDVAATPRLQAETRTARAILVGVVPKVICAPCDWWWTRASALRALRTDGSVTFASAVHAIVAASAGEAAQVPAFPRNEVTMDTMPIRVLALALLAGSAASAGAFEGVPDANPKTSGQ